MDTLTRHVWFRERGSLVIILLASFTFRSLMMGSRDLDLDEAFSFFLVTDHPLVDLLSPFSPAITSDAHPPVFYLFSHFWIETGYRALRSLTAPRELAFRFPFALIGVLTTYIMFRVGSKVGDKKLGLFLALAYGMNSFSVQISHQARMYPLVELLSATILLQWFSLRPSSPLRDYTLLGLLSGLLFLTHYASLFYLAVIWGMAFWRFRPRIRAILCGAMISILSWAWWLPGLWTQMSREIAAGAQKGSTGAIIPFTLFHFLSGDRAISLGSPVSGGLHVLVILAVSLFLALLLVFLWKIRHELPSVIVLSALVFIPLVFHWLGTFKIHRIFNGTHYAIYSLPALLLLISAAIFHRRKEFPSLATVLIGLLFFVNAVTLFSFLNNSLVPYEPWKEASRAIRACEPERVYIYPSYMSVLLRFYGPDLPMMGLSEECGEFAIGRNDVRQHIDRGKSILLVVSHDKGQGPCYQEIFRHTLEQRPYPYRFYNIRIYSFKDVS
ncbi:MAG: glycosyltransferase family 39 protein [Deltaproteobacteria bacterium]|nr:glycosyltransferase family 39 protein [Deltaproteobacteria bacterium]MBW2066214.1 glycosyltransferase family 39 protein [Deltaproteobacteria bacterium]